MQDSNPIWSYPEQDYNSATGHCVWLVRSPETVSHYTFVPNLYTCREHAQGTSFLTFYTSLTNCFAEYEQKTLYDSLVVTLAMLLRLINRRLLLLLYYYYRNVSLTGNQTPIPADRAPAVAMIG